MGTVTVTLEEIRRVAELLGDKHFLHRDEAQAKRSRFGSLIASGGHVTGLMGGVAASYFGVDSLGLELSCQFEAPVRAGDTLTIEWTVTELEPKPEKGGGIVTMTGRASNQDGVVVARGRTRALLSTLAMFGST